jgi:hypothetical protein
LFKHFWVAVDGVDIGGEFTADVNKRDKRLIKYTGGASWFVHIFAIFRKNRSGANRIIRGPKEDELSEKPEVS